METIIISIILLVVCIFLFKPMLRLRLELYRYLLGENEEHEKVNDLKKHTSYKNNEKDS